MTDTMVTTRPVRSAPHLETVLGAVAWCKNREVSGSERQIRLQIQQICANAGVSISRRIVSSALWHLTRMGKLVHTTHRVSDGIGTMRERTHTYRVKL